MTPDPREPIAAWIDGRGIRSKAEFFVAFSALDGVPDWMGHNLDALWDTVAGLIEQPFALHWTHSDASAASMGRDFDEIVEVLREAEAESAASASRPKFELHLLGGLN